MSEELNRRRSSERTGTVLDIERFSVHDGRGIRTVVFLKGCPLRCEWCANPESQQIKPQMGLFAEKCALCYKCAAVCPIGNAFKTDHKVLWEKCTNCLNCVDVCYYGARIRYGKKMTADEVVSIVKRDKVFFDNSEGGVTLSGGEMSMQPPFAVEILRKCHQSNIHTAVETCGYSVWKPFHQILEHVDLLLYDIKHMDPEKHREKTGVDNTLILENAKKASECVDEMIIRFPVIPGFNDTDENVARMACFIKDKLPLVHRVDILPYHSMGESKCERIGKTYSYKVGEPLSDKHLAHLKDILSDAGLYVSVGG